MDHTAHDLKILSICYYIQAGIIGFYSLLLLVYAAFIGVIVDAAQRSAETTGKVLPPWLGDLFATILTVIFVFAAGIALCQFLAGYWLTHHKNRTFCQVIAALSCLAIPYGTVLGIFTFMVLGRAEAKNLFAAAGHPSWPPPQKPPPPPPASV
jgi:hypothetical protein